MFLLRILAFFVLITISIVGFGAALDNPPLFIIPLVCAPLALYIVGWISRYSTTAAKVKDYKEEVALSKSGGYKYRRTFVGITAITLGGLVLYLLVTTDAFSSKPLAGLIGVIFVLMGVASVRGRNNPEHPVASPEVQRALMQEAFKEKDPMKSNEALREAARASGLSEAQFDDVLANAQARVDEESERVLQKVLDEMNLSPERRKTLEAELREDFERFKKSARP